MILFIIYLIVLFKSMNSSSRDMYNHEQMKIFVERFKRKKTIWSVWGFIIFMCDIVLIITESQ